MKSILIGANEQIYYVDLPEKHRGNFYLMSVQVPMSLEYGIWSQPVPLKYPVRTFLWCGTIARKDGSDLLDLFEEQV